MLVLAAVLLFSVGLMHSLLGGRRLISPILARSDLPIILGSVRNTRLTLWVGWHILTLFWWGQAIVLIVIEVAPAYVAMATLLTLAFSSFVAGVLAIILSQAKHRSWIMFLPLAFIAFYAAIWGGA
ncbi:hypothetical protein [Sneathiella aquimaris]|uniref:hypothetical protein n=1 Tax=Sneathiella aquimaris TaxID=2599305 RepID=UPI00146AEA19|nr:hypothetical protein [Sneathiella aquimaris]